MASCVAPSHVDDQRGRRDRPGNGAVPDLGAPPDLRTSHDKRHRLVPPHPPARPRLRVLTRNGQPTPYREWQDTVLMAPRERVEIAFVADNPGNWMFHCHILEHQDA